MEKVVKFMKTFVVLEKTGSWFGVDRLCLMEYKINLYSCRMDLMQSSLGGVKIKGRTVPQEKLTANRNLCK